MFLEVKELLNSDIRKYQERIDDLNETINNKKELTKIIKKFDRKELYIDDILPVKNIFPELSSYFIILVEISNIMYKLHDKKFDDINIDKLKNMLEKFEYSPLEIKDILGDLNLCKSSYSDVNQPNYENDQEKKKINDAYNKLFKNLDELFQIVFTKLINETKEKYSNYGNTKLLELNVNKIKRQIKKLEEIKELLDFKTAIRWVIHGIQFLPIQQRPCILFIKSTPESLLILPEGL